MSQFDGGRSLFDDSGGDEMFKSGDLLSEGFDEEVSFKGDLLSEDVEGESLSRTSLISEEEDEGEGEFSARTSLIGEEEDPPEEDPDVQGMIGSFEADSSLELRDIDSGGLAIEEDFDGTPGDEGLELEMESFDF